MCVFSEKGCEGVERNLELLAKVVDEVRDFLHMNEAVGWLNILGRHWSRLIATTQAGTP